MLFTFIDNPQTVAEFCYNLALFDSIFAVCYLGYLELVKLLTKIRKGGVKNARNS